MQHKYKIGEKTYIQKPLVLGQWRQLLNLLKGVKIPQNFDVLEIVSVFGDRLPNAIAIVLIEEGKSPRDKDIATIASQIEFEISPELTFQIIEDFFVSNPIPSLLSRLSGMTQTLARQQVETGETGLKNYASFSRTEILPDATTSCGDIPSTNANHT